MNVTPPQLESHIQYIQKKNYSIIPLEEVIAANFKPKPHHKIVVFTFDDGYMSCFENAYPILKSKNVPTTFFLPTAFIGDKSRWDGDKAKQLMCINTLKAMDSRIISYGLHSHNHISFEASCLNTIQADMIDNLAFFKNSNLSFLPVLAYPYGKRPKDPIIKNTLYRNMSDLGIRYALRIGNRVNRLPLKMPYEVQRIDVRGTDSFQQFKWKLHFGKLI
jgi:peptidoglycan/xylan/chitin deacetylase (PgdA/CDA1 family)